MSNLILLFNHTITSLQEEDARMTLGVENIIEPRADIRLLWSCLPPGDMVLVPVLEPIVSWLDTVATAGDYVLVQGDFGACYLLVTHCFKNGFTPIYSTTERHAVERHLEDGTVQLTHRFSHVRFREYGK